MKVNNQIAELNSEGRKTAVQQLEEEIRVCKNMIKCTVCSDRPKEVKTGQLFQQQFLLLWLN
jgi:E3 ubiquitin-protein ligase BRE1